MKATELRIGNIVWDDYSGNMIVSGLFAGEDFIDLQKTAKLPQGRFDINRVRGIVLDVNWLLKFGFTVEDNLLRNHKLFIKDFISLCHENKTYSVALQGILETYPLGQKMQYVHQLQNLFFALTGTELTLKP